MNNIIMALSAVVVGSIVLSCLLIIGLIAEYESTK